jgi:hypothetical protein
MLVLAQGQPWSLACGPSWDLGRLLSETVLAGCQLNSAYCLEYPT